MPFYEYRCPKCEIEILQFRLIQERDDPLACPECRHPHLERAISTMQSKKQPTGSAQSRVKDFLEAAKADLKQDKQDLSRRTK